MIARPWMQFVVGTANAIIAVAWGNWYNWLAAGACLAGAAWHFIYLRDVRA